MTICDFGVGPTRRRSFDGRNGSYQVSTLFSSGDGKGTRSSAEPSLPPFEAPTRFPASAMLKSAALWLSVAAMMRLLKCPRPRRWTVPTNPCHITVKSRGQRAKLPLGRRDMNGSGLTWTSRCSSMRLTRQIQPSATWNRFVASLHISFLFYLSGLPRLIEINNAGSLFRLFSNKVRAISQGWSVVPEVIGFAGNFSRLFEFPSRLVNFQRTLSIGTRVAAPLHRKRSRRVDRPPFVAHALAHAFRSQLQIVRGGSWGHHWR